MVRIGTGPPFGQINHANSAYFRLFLGYFRVISATRPPLLDLGLPFLHILDPALLNADQSFKMNCQHERTVAWLKWTNIRDTTISSKSKLWLIKQSGFGNFPIPLLNFHVFEIHTLNVDLYCWKVDPFLLS